MYSGYSAPGSRIAGMEIRVFRNENSSQTNAYSHYSNYSYSGLIPIECALSFIMTDKFLSHQKQLLSVHGKTIDPPWAQNDGITKIYITHPFHERQPRSQSAVVSLRIFLVRLHEIYSGPQRTVVWTSKMAGISPESVEPVLLFCDTFSHPENEVSVKTSMPILEVFSVTSTTHKL